jgi:hypothetical protein
MGDDKKYITDHSDQTDSYHYLRRITMRKPLNKRDKIFIAFLLILFVLNFASFLYPQFKMQFFFLGIFCFVASINLFLYLFRKIKSLLQASQKVDELLESTQGEN